MNFKNPLIACDFYKVDHRRQYPEGTTEVYSNFTARSSRLPGVDHVVFFGLNYFIQSFLEDSFNENFFKKDKQKICDEYQELMNKSLGKNDIGTSHLEALHDLGYLPLKIKAFPEGSHVPIGVPLLTVMNTKPEFFWLTNYIETVLSSYLWQPITAATIAYEYRKIMEKYAEITGAPKEFIDFQCHDFSFRGMEGLEAAAISGAAHLTSFKGTDTIPAIKLIEEFYGDSELVLIGASVAATEHSVMCAGGEESEHDTFKRLITEVYPSGIVSIVSDTWDFWKVIGETLPDLKPFIMERDGKVVVRPDSGDPVKIICGDESAEEGSLAFKGAVECLWEIFGGITNEKGYKMLDSHIGLIYGDSITLERAEQILSRLEKKGFASSNIVFGVGSYTYQYNTRDTFGFAMKATSVVINGERKNISKNPKTDNGEKKSACGLLRVENVNGMIKLFQNQTREEELRGLLEVRYENERISDVSFKDIRVRVQNSKPSQD